MPPVKAGDHDEAFFAKVHALLDQINVAQDNQVTAPPEAWREAVTISRDLGYTPRSGCNVCRLQVVDKLRLAVGLMPARRPASTTLQQERLAICSSCPAYNSTWQSCGRFITDAVSPHIIEIDGRPVKPCGCYLPAKVRFRSEHCPGNFWPR